MCAGFHHSQRFPLSTTILHRRRKAGGYKKLTRPTAVLDAIRVPLALISAPFFFNANKRALHGSSASATVALVVGKALVVDNRAAL